MLPLDTPIDWVALKPMLYFVGAGASISVALLLALRPFLRSTIDLTKRHDWVWGLLLLLILVAGRWPSIIFPRELDADESQMFAGAFALTLDPVFWRSVDGHTAGPIDFFALWPAGGLFGWNNYLAPRMTALFALAISLIFAHQCIALVAGRSVARVATLGATCLEALTNAIGLQHYSTELIPMALLSCAAYAIIRRWAHEGNVCWNMGGGLLIGAVPLAKLQAGPTAFCLGLAWLLAECFHRSPERPRRIAYLLAAAILPVTCFAVQLTVAGEWTNALIPYIQNNISYTQAGPKIFSTVWLELLKTSITHDSLYHLWLPATVISCLLMLRFRLTPDRTLRIFLGASGLFCLITLFAIILPGRPVLHYCQFLIVPATLMLGGMIGNLLTIQGEAWRKFNQSLIISCITSILLLMLFQRAAAPNELLGKHAALSQYRRSSLSHRIIPHVRPGDTLAIWGWSNFVNIETGLPQAIRDAHIAPLIMPGPYRTYYRDRYLHDFLQALPVFFLDSIGVHSLAFQQKILTHDQNFPVLAAVIQSHYVLIEEHQGARLYLRRDQVNRL